MVHFKALIIDLCETLEYSISNDDYFQMIKGARQVQNPLNFVQGTFGLLVHQSRPDCFLTSSQIIN